jgi:SpoIID/LytB domain protein
MHINDPFQSCAEQHCQVYSGTSKENPLVSKAVDATTGEMLFFREELVDSVYSACCGGHTESSSFVWGTAEKPYLAGVPDVEKGTGEISEKNIENWIRNPPKEAFCASTSFGNKSFRWSKTVLFKDIEKNINSIQKIGSLKDLVILERGKSGRISKILAKGSAGEVMLQPELKIRKVLGDLKSSKFIFSLEKNDKGEIQSVNFSGGGFGHGAGMCQMGAIGMAEKGHNYKEILKHYYSGAEVIKIY